MFKKILSSIGIGSSKVDTVIHNSEVVMGNDISGVINITGGDVEQSINGIYLEVFTQFVVETNDNKYYEEVVLNQISLATNFVIKPGQHQSIDFTINVPLTAPITFNYQGTGLKTRIDIPNAIDQTDKDDIIVRPVQQLQEMLAEVEQLGFKHSYESGRCKGARKTFGYNTAFCQEFEVKPTNSHFRGKLDELELLIAPAQNGWNVLLEVDKRGGLLDNFMGTDEKHIRFNIDVNQPYQRGTIQNIIQRFI